MNGPGRPPHATWRRRGVLGSSRRARGAALVLGPLVLLLSACGLGADPSPTIVNSHDVPYKLLAPATTTTQVGPQREYVTIYLDGPQHLVPFSTALPPPVTVRKVLAALDKGPTSTQAAQGLKSPISTAAPLSLASDAGGTVTVDVGSGFTALAEQDQAIAAAQLVYTLTALPHVTSVVIRIDGKHAKVPTGTGTLSGQPLTRADYASLAPI